MNQFLSDAARILSSRESTSALLDRLVRAAVPRTADFCLVFLVRDDDLACVASAHATPDGERLLRRLKRVYRITRDDPVSTVAHVVRSGRPKLRTEITGEAIAPQSDLHVFTLHRRLAARSVLVVPIASPPDVLGAVSLSYAQSGRHYTAQDVPAARRLATLIAALIRQRTAGQAQAAPRVPLVTRRPLRLRARV